MYPNPIHWYAGQFLDPQHLQESDRYHEHSARLVLSLTRPWAWGVREAKVDPAMLAGGVLSFEKLELVFPDGTYALWNGMLDAGNVAEVPRIKLDGISGDAAVVEAVLRQRREQNNLAAAFDLGRSDGRTLESNGGERAISIVDSKDTQDAFALADAALVNPCRLSRLYYNVRLRLAGDGSDAPGDGVLAVVRVKKVDGQFRLDDGFVPPVYAFDANAALSARLEQFMDRLESFPRRLAEAGDADSTSGMAEMFARQAAAGLLAELAALREIPLLHPADVYRVLRHGQAQLVSAAQMAGIAPSDTLPVYDHTQPAASLFPLLRSCEDCLARYMPVTVATIAPTYQERLLLFALPEAANAPGVQLVLFMAGDESMREVVRGGRVVAGSPEKVRAALRLALPEVTLRPIPAPRGLPSGRGGGYLMLDTTQPAWRDARDARQLAVAYYPEPNPGPDRLVESCRLLILGGGL